MADITAHEDMIRDLVAYGDELGMTAVELLVSWDDCQLDTAESAKVRTIIEHVYDWISDSLIEDLLEELINQDDNFNE